MAGVRQEHSALTRRSFLKTSAVAAGTVVGTGALSGLVATASADEQAVEAKPENDQIFASVCRGNCANQCFLNIHVRDGFAVRTSMRPFCDERFNRICPKGLAYPEKIYSPQRIKYPLKRAGERGAGEWERISWEEAIAEITDKWKSYREEFGPNSVAFSTRTGQHGTSFRTAYSRLTTMFGGVSINGAADQEFGQALVDTGGLDPANSALANDQSELANAKCILCQGVNVTESLWHAWHFINEAKQQGAKLIVVDPMFTGIAAKADLWLPLRPATDFALFAAMSNIAIENGWVDWDFLKEKTTVPFLIKEDGTFLRQSEVTGVAPGEGETDALVVLDADTGKWGVVGEVANPVVEGTHVVEGINVTSPWTKFLSVIAEWTPARAAEVCDLSEEKIRTAAEWFCTNGPSSLILGLGPDHRFYGNQGFHASMLFDFLTGNACKSGAGWSYCANYTVAYASAGIAIPEGAEPEAPSFKVAPSQLVNVLKTGKYGDTDVPLKMMISYGTDTIHMRGNRQETLEALDNLECLVSINLEMNDTSLYADYLLPVCEWCEYEEINGAQTYYPFITYQEQAIEPAFECKSDFEIVKLLFQGMGHPEWFDWELPDLFERYYGKELYERIKSEKCLEHQFFADNDNKYVYGQNGKIYTSTGRLQFYTEKPTAYKYNPYGNERDMDYLRMPSFKLPQEAWNEDVEGYPKRELANKYPLSMQETHYRWTSQTNFARVAILGELNPEPTVRMSAKDAQDRGIAGGELVRVFNDRGEAVVRAVVNNGIRPGIVDIPNGWLADQFVKGTSVDLQNAECDENIENSSFSDCLVEIELYEG